MKFPWNKNQKDNVAGQKTKIPGETPVKKKTLTKGKDYFGEAENVKDVWDLTKDDAYVRPVTRHRLPRFVIPTVVFIGMIVLLFWLLPKVVPQILGNSSNKQEAVVKPTLIYGVDTRVVNVYATNLMAEDSITSTRISQVLYNEPVTLLDTDCAEGYIHIQTQDGLEGYIKSQDVTEDRDSVEPNLHLFKLVVSDMSKNVKSAASSGTLLVEVMMNTTLYADEKRDGVYRVLLPGGTQGWIGSSGVIEVGVDDPLDVVGVRYFVSSVLSFVNMTQLDHGLTKRGLSVEGLAYISANVNGVTLPRKMEEQIKAGSPVDLIYDEVTNLLDVNSIRAGDLVFFSDPSHPDAKEPYEMGICTETDLLLMTSASRTTLRLVTLSKSAELKARIIAVRRIFN